MTFFVHRIFIFKKIFLFENFDKAKLSLRLGRHVYTDFIADLINYVSS